MVTKTWSIGKVTTFPELLVEKFSKIAGHCPQNFEKLLYYVWTETCGKI
jgi:hypothetical protein